MAFRAALLFGLLALSLSQARQIAQGEVDADDEYIQELHERAQTTPKPAAGGPIAFSAEMSANRKINGDLPLTFDRVITNEGGLYYGSSGQFLCGDDGAYLFVWNTATASMTGNMRCFLKLRIGGADVKYGPETSYYNHVTESGSVQMTSLVQCINKQMTAVSIMSALRTPKSPVPTYHSGYSSFSGHRVAAKNRAVGFTADLSTDTRLYPGSRIVFDHVVSNFGGHYKKLHGFFKCSDDMLYSFTVSIHAPYPIIGGTQWSSSRLMMDGKVVMNTPVTYKAINGHESGSASTTVVLQCKQHKDVYVEADQTHTFASSIFGAQLTSFTGIRLCYENCKQHYAFTAILSENVTTNNKAVHLKTVLTNVGNAYKAANGAFVCPDNGVYMFTWSAASTMGNCRLDLYKESALQKQNTMLYQTSALATGTSGSATMSTVIKCTKNNHVFLKATGLNTNNYLLAQHTVFSGYKIPQY